MKKKLLKDLPFLRAGEVVETIGGVYRVENGRNQYVFMGISPQWNIIASIWKDPEWFEQPKNRKFKRMYQKAHSYMLDYVDLNGKIDFGEIDMILREIFNIDD